LAAEKMPVVVSMGGYAASGGYWISAGGDVIFAEPTTITGSIGVYGMLVNIQKLGNEYGVTWDTVKTGTFADAMTMARPKTEAEMALFQRSVSEIYTDFVALVAEGRGLSAEQVEKIAQGRVWSGVSAYEIGLVDELGGLAAAIAEAADRAELDDGFRLKQFPRKRALADAISEALGNLQSKAAGSGILSQLQSELKQVTGGLEQFNDPRGIYARMPLELEL
jgi:protease-4